MWSPVLWRSVSTARWQTRMAPSYLCQGPPVPLKSIKPQQITLTHGFQISRCGWFHSRYLNDSLGRRYRFRKTISLMLKKARKQTNTWILPWICTKIWWILPSPKQTDRWKHLAKVIKNEFNERNIHAVSVVIFCSLQGNQEDSVLQREPVPDGQMTNLCSSSCWVF